jgi:fructokinase
LTKTPKKVLAYGETLWDLLPTGAVLGGAPFNFAYRVNSLGDRGLIVSRLGRDELGLKAASQAVALGMDTSYIQWDDHHPTGTVKITLDEKNNPDYYIVPGVAYDHIKANDSLLEIAAASDCLCFGTLIQRTPTARQTLQKLFASAGKSIKLLDINLRKNCYTRQTTTLSLQEADILKLNEEEAQELAEMFGTSARDIPAFSQEMIERWGLCYSLVSFGERGAFAVSKEGDKAYVPGYEVALVDPCGSGDAFTAGFVHLLLRDKPLAECLELANALGAMVARQAGATAPISPDHIKKFMDAKHRRIFQPHLKKFAIL